jgi:sugar-specific transcriptional regulator TrmB
MESIFGQLQQLGLSDKEARVYLAALELGASSISNLAKTAKVKRTTVYHLLQSLIDKNLITKVPRGKRNFFRAEHPSVFLDLLKNQEKVFSYLVPLLEQKFKSTTKLPLIQIYEGKKQIYSAYEKLLNTFLPVYAIFSPEDYFSTFSHEENAKLFDLLRQKGGFLFDIVQISSPSPQKINEIKNTPYRKGISRIKVFPQPFHSSTDILVTGNKVLISDLRTETSIYIENETIAEIFRVLLKFIWNILK